MPIILTQPDALRRLQCLILLLAIACLPGLAQTGTSVSPHAPSKSSGVYRVAGTLVNVASGEPVRRATVAILAEADSHAVASVESDNDGHFVFEGLPAAKYQLTASKRGFRTAFYDEHEEFSTAIVTGEGQDTEGLNFHLVSGSILHGVVTADGGDPVENANVMLFLKPHANKPGNRVTQVESTNTDDNGAYEFGNLAAGEYLLAVKAEPWFALHSSASRTQPNSSDDTTALKAALDVAYPITFFDAATEEASASSIVLAGGSREEANINLHAVPALHLLVDTPRKPDGSIARPELRQTIFGTQVSAENAGFIDAMRTGTAEFTGVAPGHYELEQGDPPRILELDASANQQVDPTLGTPTVAVSGAVHVSSGSAPPESLTLTLESLDNTHRFVQIQLASRQSGASSAAVPPGEWKVWAFSPGSQWQVLSTAVNGRSHPGNLLTVRDRPLSIVVTIGEGATRVEGFARRDGKGVAGVMVVLVPKDLASLQGVVRRDQSDSDGSFSLHDVVPGQYTVVAIQDGWDLDWALPEVIGRFLPRGIAVTVTDSSGNLLHLTQPVPVQSR